MLKGPAKLFYAKAKHLEEACAMYKNDAKQKEQLAEQACERHAEVYQALLDMMEVVIAEGNRNELLLHPNKTVRSAAKQYLEYRDKYRDERLERRVKWMKNRDLKGEHKE